MNVFVVGPPQSGASAVARLVNLCGFHIGEREELFSPSDQGTRCWESRWLVDFNNNLLFLFGADWHSAGRINADTLPIPILNPFRQRATTWGATMDQKGDWVCKDPRLCLTMSFWLGVRHSALVVLIVRHPKEAVASIMHRKVCPYPAVESALAVWRRHFTGALADTAGKKRIVLDYDRLISDLDAELTRLIEFFEANIPCYKAPAELREQVAMTIAPMLRSNTLSDLSTEYCEDRDIEAYEAFISSDEARLDITLKSYRDQPISFDVERLVQFRNHETFAKDQQVNKLERLLAEQSKLMVERATYADLSISNSQSVYELQQKLAAIEDSLAWTLIMRWKRVRDVLLPDDTRRRKLYDRVKDFFKFLVQKELKGVGSEALGKQRLSAGRELWNRTAFSFISLSSLTPISREDDPLKPLESMTWYQNVNIDDVTKFALFMSLPSCWSYRLLVPRRARFHACVALEMQEADCEAVEFELKAQAVDGRRGAVQKKFVYPTRVVGHRRWVKFRVNLKRFADENVELTLTASVPNETGAKQAWAIWGDPIIRSRRSLTELASLGRGYLWAYGFSGTLKKILSRVQSRYPGVPQSRGSYRFSVSNHELNSSGSQRLRKDSNKHLDPQPQTMPYLAPSILTVPKETIQAKVSVVIPTKNGMSDQFESTLRAIYQQKGIANLEVIIVDSGSSDGTVKIAEDFGATVYRIPPEEFNHGTTRNYGAEKGDGAFIAFLTQDVIPTSDDLFYEMVTTLLGEAKLAGVSVRQVPRSNADIYACWERWNHNEFQLEGPPWTLGNPESYKLGSIQLRRLAGLDNTCSMVKRSIWEKIRFQPTMYGEDLRFGLSCVRQGYKIGWLPHRSVIHSHTRPALYYMSRHSIERRVFLQFLPEGSRARWTRKITFDKLFASVNDLYLFINEFFGSWGPSSSHNPTSVLRLLLSSLSTVQGPIHRNRHLINRGHDEYGEPTLDDFFASLQDLIKADLPRVNPCMPGFAGTIESILRFLGERYPRVASSEIRSLVYKAYAGAAGNVLGELCFWASEQGNGSSDLDRVDNLLRRRMQG